MKRLRATAVTVTVTVPLLCRPVRLLRDDRGYYQSVSHVHDVETEARKQGAGVFRSRSADYRHVGGPAPDKNFLRPSSSEQALLDALGEENAAEQKLTDGMPRQLNALSKENRAAASLEARKAAMEQKRQEIALPKNRRLMSGRLPAILSSEASPG